MVKSVCCIKTVRQIGVFLFVMGLVLYLLQLTHDKAALQSMLLTGVLFMAQGLTFFVISSLALFLKKDKEQK